MAHSRCIKLVTTLILLTVQVTRSAKNNARPVYEVINEQARMDDIRLSSGPAILPYGNPLAGNSAHIARLHASNQQAMFNAERIRQHKAQLQRLTQGPPIIDSYMKAYHESQESHQLALEQQQANIKDDVTTTPPINTKKQIRGRVPQISKQRASQNNRETQVRNVPTRTQIRSRTSNSETEKVNRAERNRNHRSYDSYEYQQYLNSREAKAQFADTAFDEGVTIKPNGNNGLAQEQIPAASTLQVRGVAGSSKYLPKNHDYQTVQDINALQLLLNKNPNEQLSEFNTLISGKLSEKDTADTPVDLYYYLKDPSADVQYNGPIYKQIPSTYASDNLKDHTPISEEMEDVESPSPFKIAYVTPQISTEAPPLETSTLQTNYYKVEVASQTLRSNYKPGKINEELYLHEDSPYQTAHYGSQPTPFYKHTNSDDGESYLHNSQGVQHLTQDGTGVSAYGDDNLHYAANYEFGYRVHDEHSGNYFGQFEAKEGEKTKGHYHVLLPDGRMQKVVYSAGPSGYHADISYDHLQN